MTASSAGAAGTLQEGTATGVDARIRVQRPDFDLDLDLRAGPGEVVALLGPNGAGKTTALRVLAGLQHGTGRVALDGAPLDPLPPERRRVGLVPQDGLLLPHLSALDNVAYGLRARGVRKAQARARAREELARVGIEQVDAPPRTLSGGEAQRVALARALATDPRLLLLDEPLAALDALTRTDVRSDLRARLRAFGGPTVLVTHDPVDALVLADRLVVLERGRVVQEGPPPEVAARPRTAYVAGLVGLNLLHATGVRGRVRVLDLELPSEDGPVLVAFPPQAVRLGEGGAPQRVVALEQQGTTTRVLLDSGVSALVPAGRSDLRTGAATTVRVAPADVAVYR